MICKICGKESLPTVSGECTDCLFKKLAKKLSKNYKEVKEMDLNDGTKAEKQLEKLNKRDLIHLLAWAMPRGALTQAINNELCPECEIIKIKLKAAKINRR